MRTLTVLACLLTGSLAYAAAPATRAAERAAGLKANLGSFSLQITYNGPEDRPMPRLYLHVAAVDGRDPGVQITPEQAGRIVDYLATEGFLDQAGANKDMAVPNGYTMVVAGGDNAKYAEWYVPLGTPEKLLPRLAGLRTVLEGDAAKAADHMLRRLGYKEEEPASRPSEKAQKRAAELRSDVDRLSILLEYCGPADKPLDNLFLSKHIVGEPRLLDQRAEISPQQAEAIIAWLLADGFLDRAADIRNKELAMPAGPTYTLVVAGGKEKVRLFGDLGWAPDLFPHLDGLRKVLDGDAAKAMDLLLGRLAGYRPQK